MITIKNVGAKYTYKSLPIRAWFSFKFDKHDESNVYIKRTESSAISLLGEMVTITDTNVAVVYFPDVNISFPTALITED